MKNIDKKASFEDRFYRNYVKGKHNHPEGWAKDKKLNRKHTRNYLKQELRDMELNSELEEIEGEEMDYGEEV